MKNYLLIICLAAIPVASAWAMGEADPLLYKVKIDQLEFRQGDGKEGLAFEAEAWVGRDHEKFWIKSSIEKEGDFDIDRFQKVVGMLIPKIFT